jgi:DNA-binding winged helix-turn-helix (wHTH) protein
VVSWSPEMQSSSGSSVRVVSATFGDCLLDGESRLLRRKGKVVHLTPKAFALLELLLARRPAVVKKQEIMHRLWPNTFVVEANVPNLVAEIREAMGDPVERSRFIRTVHREGYAFCGSAKVTGASAEAEVLSNFSLVFEGREFPLARGSNTVGRGETCRVRVDSQTVSRRHADIRVADGSASIEDLGSKNGTVVRGTRVRGVVPLADGEEIRVGEVHLRLRVTARNAETKTFSAGDMLRHRQGEPTSTSSAVSDGAASESQTQRRRHTHRKTSPLS